jgi:hypothetical protein
MARFKKNETTQSTGYVNTDVARNSGGRLPSLP